MRTNELLNKMCCLVVILMAVVPSFSQEADHVSLGIVLHPVQGIGVDVYGNGVYQLLDVSRVGAHVDHAEGDPVLRVSTFGTVDASWSVDTTRGVVETLRARIRMDAQAPNDRFPPLRRERGHTTRRLQLSAAGGILYAPRYGISGEEGDEEPSPLRDFVFLYSILAR